MEELFAGVVGRLFAIAGLLGLATGFLVPRLGAALGIALFLGSLSVFLLASVSGTPVPMAGWALGVIGAMVAAGLGWWLRSLRRS